MENPDTPLRPLNYPRTLVKPGAGDLVTYQGTPGVVIRAGGWPQITIDFGEFTETVDVIDTHLLLTRSRADAMEAIYRDAVPPPAPMGWPSKLGGLIGAIIVLTVAALVGLVAFRMVVTVGEWAL